MNEYNLKIKEYSEQYVITTYANSIKERDEFEKHLIQLKRIRCEHSHLLLDKGDGIGVYAVYWQEWEDLKNEYFFENDLDLKEYEEWRRLFNGLCPFVYEKTLTSDFEKELRSVQTSMNRTKNKIYDLAYANHWQLFVTLTFDDEKLLKKYGGCAWNYDVCVKALKSFFTVLKRNYNNIQYIGVPELHHFYYNTLTHDKVIFNGEELTDEFYKVILQKENRTFKEQELIYKVEAGEYKRRYHFHFLFNNFPISKLVDSNLKDCKGRTIYNLLNYSLGFTTATIVEDVAATQFYITKYITKELIATSKGKKRYWASRNLNKPVEQNFFLDFDELKTLKEDLCNTTEYVKELKVENDNFVNVITKYVVLDYRLLGNNILSDYVEQKTNVIKIPNTIKYDLETYLNINSIFNPINKLDNGIILFNNKYYKFNRTLNKIELKEL